MITDGRLPPADPVPLDGLRGRDDHRHHDHRPHQPTHDHHSE